jgi:hypothetical protein
VVRELLGSRDLSYSERRAYSVSASASLTSNCAVLLCRRDQGAGGSRHVGKLAGLYVDMTQAFNEGKIKPRDGRTAENTTPTRFEDFVVELKQAYETI